MIDRTLDRPSAGFSTTTRAGQPKKSPMQTGGLSHFIEPAEKLILQYPAVALASAFLVGVALACWIKRK